MEANKKFTDCPKLSECINRADLIDFNVGEIFSHKSSTFCNRPNLLYIFLRKITGIEQLKTFPNSFVISSVLVGAIVSECVYEKTKKTLFGKKFFGEERAVVVEYYNQEHIDKNEMDEEIEVFTTSKDPECFYYSINTSKLDSVKVSIENKNGFLGYR